MKIAIVVQRYGLDISPGGAEIHARYIAERLARLATVEVLTTCAKDHITWKNELPPGEETVRGVVVRRFPVNHPRDPREFGRCSKTVFETTHSVSDELTGSKAKGRRAAP